MEHAQIEWNNGVPVSAAYGDIYYSTENGLEESEYVFIRHNDLYRRWERDGALVVLETGFGTGLNFCATLRAWKTARTESRLHFFSIEKHPIAPQDLQRVAAQWPQLGDEYRALLQQYPPAVRGMHTLAFEGGRVSLHLCFDEILPALQRLECVADAIYLDGFVPSMNPQMWTFGVITQLARLSRPGTTFSTYTAAGDVRRALSDAGYAVRKTAGFGRKREMLTGAMLSRPCFRDDRPWYSAPPYRPPARECAIVGAGLAGIATARSLARRGWRVTLLDRHAQPAAEASGNPAGLLMPRLSRAYSEDARFYALAALYAARVLGTLQADASQESPFWFNTGILDFGRGGDAAGRLPGEEYPTGFMQAVDARRAGELAGIPVGRGAVFLPRFGYVRPDVLCRHLLARCGESVAYRRFELKDAVFGNGEWRLDGADAEMRTPVLVLANAARAAALRFTDWLPLQRSQGQVSRLDTAGGGDRLRVPLSGACYLTPAVEGSCITGASYAHCGSDEPGPDVRPDPVRHRENTDALARMLGDDAMHALAWRDAPVSGGRAAVRCTTPDRAPVVGAVPDRGACLEAYADLHHGRRNKAYPPAPCIENAFITSGHGSRGLSTCLLSGELLAAMMNGEPLPVDRPMAELVHPARFIVRSLRKRGRE